MSVDIFDCSEKQSVCANGGLKSIDIGFTRIRFSFFIVTSKEDITKRIFFRIRTD